MVPDFIEDQNGVEVPFQEINNIFAQSSYHQKLASMPRYDRFRPANVTPAEWIRWLGADVDNFKHMQLTYKLTWYFLEEHEKAHTTNLNEDEKKILLMTSLVHDWGEAFTGDISFDLKTEAHEKEEILRLRQILAELLGNRFSETIRNQLAETALSRNSKLGSMFNIIERIGYMRTCLNAWGARPTAKEVSLKNAFGWLASNVAGNQIPPLLNVIEKYPPVRKYLGGVRGRINDLFLNMPTDIFNNHPEDQRGGQAKKFADAKKVWIESEYGQGPDY